jgi:hypothetical protein
MNNVFFYIEIQNKNKILVEQLEEALTSYKDIISYIKEICEYNYITSDLIAYYKNLSFACEDQIITIKEIIKLNETQIYEQCNHNFITDIIDIDPEKEKTVCYCTICELTKRE